MGVSETRSTATVLGEIKSCSRGVHLLQIPIAPNPASPLSSELADDTIKGYFCLLLNFSYI